MRRTNTVALAPSISQHQRLLEIADSCAQLWNEITYRRRQSLFAGKISWDWNDLYDKYKSIVGASSAQQIERKNSESWRSYFALLKLRKTSKTHQKNQTTRLLER